MDKTADEGEYFFEEDNPVINIAASAQYRRQTTAYADAYREWRSNGQNAYAYNYISDTREHAYRKGRGFIHRHPSLTEKKSIRKNMSLLGMILIGVLLWDVAGPYIFVQVTRFFGSAAEYDLWNGLSKVSDGYRLACLLIVQGAGLAVPMLLMSRITKLPREVLFPTRVCNPAMHNMAFPLALALLVVLHQISEFYTLVLSKLGMEAGNWDFFIPESLPLRAGAFLIQVILLPILWEMFIHGTILQSLRQFGDGFALLASSVIFTLLCHDVTQFFYYAITSLVIGYYVLCTGSLRTGFIMRAVIMTGEYGLYWIHYTFTPDRAVLYGTAFQFILLAGSVIALFIYCRDKQKMLSLAMPKTHVSVYEKILCSLNATSVMLWLTLVVLFSIESLKFKI